MQTVNTWISLHIRADKSVVIFHLDYMWGCTDCLQDKVLFQAVCMWHKILFLFPIRPFILGF